MVIDHTYKFRNQIKLKHTTSNNFCDEEVVIIRIFVLNNPSYPTVTAIHEDYYTADQETRARLFSVIPLRGQSIEIEKKMSLAVFVTG